MMDRKILLLMLALITVSWAQDLQVFQPSSAQGTEGSSVVLICSYNTTSDIKIRSYWWVKDPGLVVKNTTQEFMERVNCTPGQDFLLANRANIEIRNLRLTDSGMYRCVVNIHGLQEASGKGTELQVIKRAFVVSQPSFAQGTEGGSVTLHCFYILAHKPKVGSYWWMKNQSLLVENTTQEFMGRIKRPSTQQFLSERRANIEIQHLTLNDSGMYQCVVNIHGLPETSGEGTELQVRGRGDPQLPESKPGTLLYLILGAGLVSGFVVSVAGCFLFLCRRTTQGCQAIVSGTQCPQQDWEVEAELQYAEIVVKAEKNHMSQREEFTYIVVDTQDGESCNKSACSPHHKVLDTYSG